MRLFFKLLACVVITYALAAYITIQANPEIKFWHSVDQLRDREIAAIRLSQPGKPIIFFTGGSSCAFSIDPKIIEDTCGMPAFNLGLPISAGPKYILHQALEKTRKGDILVILLEPDVLTFSSESKPSNSAFGLAIKNGDPSATVGGRSFGETLALRDWLNFSRPGPAYLATWLAKAATGRGYRYESKDIRYHGRIETQVSLPTLPLAGTKTVNQIDPTGRKILTMFQQAASQKGVKLFYSMPWLLTAESSAAENRAANLKILESIHTMIPTVDDGYLGVATDATLFSDSAQHLSAKGSSIRSQGLANALQVWLGTAR